MQSSNHGIFLGFQVQLNQMSKYAACFCSFYYNRVISEIRELHLGKNNMENNLDNFQDGNAFGVDTQTECARVGAKGDEQCGDFGGDGIGLAKGLHLTR